MSTARKKKSDLGKEEVIHIRTTPKDKSLIEKAADIVGLSTSAFMLQNAIKAARNELSVVERVILSSHDAEKFYAALVNPPPPNKALKDAFGLYNKHSKR